jgi:diadenosine tetraphosphatase ApaH/serine/threonine PP2A family protein phosphatase
MRIAVFGDVHANLEALDAALDAISLARADAIVCLGDIVGYGAEPKECIARLRQTASLIVAGNHDLDVSNGAHSPGTNATARLMIDWTRSQIDEESKIFLARLPRRIIVQGALVAAHGCYLNPEHVNGYVTSTMLEANLRAIARNTSWPHLAFCGHTHVPMCGWIEGDMCIERKPGAPLRWPSSAQAILVNPGSVGQPRDGDPRAAFAIVDTELRSVEVVRVAYDIEAAARAIERSGLPSMLADRLREGR